MFEWNIIACTVDKKITNSRKRSAVYSSFLTFFNGETHPVAFGNTGEREKKIS